MENRRCRERYAFKASCNPRQSYPRHFLNLNFSPFLTRIAQSTWIKKAKSWKKIHSAWKFPCFHGLRIILHRLPKRPTCVTCLFPTIFILRLGEAVESYRFFGRAAKRELYFIRQPLSPRSEK